MKKILFLSTIVFLAVAAASCTKEHESEWEKMDDTSPLTGPAIYYVKYQARSGGPYYYINSISVATDKGTKTFTGDAQSWTQSWTQTFGPVQKGFRASISVNGSSASIVQIYVSRSNEPFALKASGNYQASYTIDY